MPNSIESVDDQKKDKALIDNGTNNPTEGLTDQHDLLKAYPELKLLKDELDQIANE